MPYTLPLKRMAASLSDSAPSSPIVSESTEPLTLQDLMESSVPDTGTSNTYAGPPIGCSAKVIIHNHYITKAESTTIFGSMLAERPLYIMECKAQACMTCRPRAAAITRTSSMRIVRPEAVENAFKASGEKHGRNDSGCVVVV